MADLTTLIRVKTLLGDPNPSVPAPGDARLSQTIAAASDLVRNYTQRTFEVTAPGAVPTPRLFEYDGSGFLDIDDCQSIAGITVSGGYTGSPTYTLTVDEWASYPLNSPVKAWLRLPYNQWGVGISPEMGFTYNLDTLWYKGSMRPNVVTVTGLWGWPVIPDDVQQAVAWVAISLDDSPHPYQSESIENYSRTLGSEAGSEAIPDRAKAALTPYIIPAL